MSRPANLIAVVTWGLVLVTIGCTSNVGTTPHSVESQLESGALIYRKTCATNTCHGTQGQGLRSGDDFKIWPLVGDEFQLRHPNAQIVFDVIRSGSEKNLLALTDQQVYDAIAYQLDQNRIVLQSPLTADNAYSTYGGKMSGNAKAGIYPLSDNVQLYETIHTTDLPIVAGSKRLRIQVDQLAQAVAIGNNKGNFLVLVLVFNVQGSEQITLTPEYLSLSTPGGELLNPQSINIHAAIERFHEQTIRPGYGTVGLVVFTLTTPDGFDQLIYDDGAAGNRLTLRLKP